MVFQSTPPPPPPQHTHTHKHLPLRLHLNDWHRIRERENYYYYYEYVFPVRATALITSIHHVRKESLYEKERRSQVNSQHPLPGLHIELCDVRHTLEPCKAREQFLRDVFVGATLQSTTCRQKPTKYPLSLSIYLSVYLYFLFCIQNHECHLIGLRGFIQVRQNPRNSFSRAVMMIKLLLVCSDSLLSRAVHMVV